MKNIWIVGLLVFTMSCSSLHHDTSSPVIQLTKKRCMGKCPVYDLMIYQNGLVNYNGIDHVEKKGLHQFNLSAKKIEELTQIMRGKSKFIKH